MPEAFLLPEIKATFFGTSGAYQGKPLAGGAVYFWEPGGYVTPQATYTDGTMSVANPNPVILDSNGMANIWISGYYNIQVYDANGILQYTVPNVSDLSSGTGSTIDQWTLQTLTSLTYVSGNVFSCLGDLTGTFVQGTRIQAIVTGGTITGTVVSSSFNGAVTTVTCIWDTSTTLNAGLSQVSIGLISVTSNVIPVYPVLTKSGAYTMKAKDINHVFYFSTVAPISFTLLAASLVPSGAWLEICNDGVSALTFIGTVNGVTNPILASGDRIKIVSDGTSWTGRSSFVSLLASSTIYNSGLTASVSNGALTVSLVGADGSTPSVNDPVFVAFQKVSTGNTPAGTTVLREVNIATSVTLSCGSTLGFICGQTGNIYVWAFDNAGTVVLGLSGTPDHSQIMIQSPTAEGGIGGADSASTLYTPTDLTNVAVRLLGVINISTSDNIQNQSAGLAISSTTAYVKNNAFYYTISNVQYYKAASITDPVTNTLGYAPGSTTIPQSKYGAVAFDIDVNGAVVANSATNNASGYSTSALAIAGLPAVSASYHRMGYVTIINTSATFVCGTTALSASGVTVLYYNTQKLMIGTTVTNVANTEFSYSSAGIEYHLATNFVGNSLGTTVIPQNLYGAVALDIDAIGNITAIPATANTTGYSSSALAVAGLPFPASGLSRLGWVTAMKTTAAFTFGTTSLADANATVAYTSNPLTLGQWIYTSKSIALINDSLQSRMAWSVMYANQYGIPTDVPLLPANTGLPLVSNGSAVPSFEQINTVGISTGAITGDKLSSVTAGTANTLVNSNGSSQTYSASYVKLFQWLCNRTGIITITVTAFPGYGTACYIHIYKNGAPVGTELNIPLPYNNPFKQDLSFVAGDLVQVYAHAAGGPTWLAITNVTITCVDPLEPADPTWY
jgi:hypothetical protein